jgi:hypothetical protein
MSTSLDCPRRKIGFGTVTVSSSALDLVNFGFTAAQYTGDASDGGAHCVMLTTGAQPVRYRHDGTAPTTTVGHYVAANTTEYIYLDRTAAVTTEFQIIAVSTDSVCYITLLGEKTGF